MNFFYFQYLIDILSFFMDFMMDNNIEDKLGRFLLMSIFSGLFMAHILSMINQYWDSGGGFFWRLDFYAQLCSTLFMGFFFYYTVHRLPPQNCASGVIPRIVAIGGTFLMMFLVALPPEQVGPVRDLISAVLTIAGTTLSIWCLIQLGRSFSIMATARELKTRGSYAIVRHPLYAAELLMMTGIMLGHGSPFAFAMGAVWLPLQICRAHFEERVLRKTFPDYEDYAARVPMLIPLMSWHWRAPVKQGI
ncbi:MAG: isoprenylcysteine carboxylmethyltransferase family protein [Rhizobiaceae bacterium]